MRQFMFPCVRSDGTVELLGVAATDGVGAGNVDAQLYGALRLSVARGAATAWSVVAREYGFDISPAEAMVDLEQYSIHLAALVAAATLDRGVNPLAAMGLQDEQVWFTGALSIDGGMLSPLAAGSAAAKRNAFATSPNGRLLFGPAHLAVGAPYDINVLSVAQFRMEREDREFLRSLAAGTARKTVVVVEPSEVATLLDALFLVPARDEYKSRSRGPTNSERPRGSRDSELTRHARLTQEVGSIAFVVGAPSAGVLLLRETGVVSAVFALFIVTFFVTAVMAFLGPTDPKAMARARVDLPTWGGFVVVVVGILSIGLRFGLFEIFTFAQPMPEQYATYFGIVAALELVQTCTWWGSKRFASETGYRGPMTPAARACLRYFQRPHGARTLITSAALATLALLVWCELVPSALAVFVFGAITAANELVIGSWRAARERESGGPDV